jgi:hypothetical protein
LWWSRGGELVDLAVEEEVALAAGDMAGKDFSPGKVDGSFGHREWGLNHAEIDLENRPNDVAVAEQFGWSASLAT